MYAIRSYYVYISTAFYLRVVAGNHKSLTPFCIRVGSDVLTSLFGKGSSIETYEGSQKPDSETPAGGSTS